MNIDLSKIVMQEAEVQDVKLVTKQELNEMIEHNNFRHSHANVFRIFWNEQILFT
jgi:hypothetical protein